MIRRNYNSWTLRRFAFRNANRSCLVSQRPHPGSQAASFQAHLNLRHCSAVLGITTGSEETHPMWRETTTAGQKSVSEPVGNATRTALSTATRSMISCVMAPPIGGKYPRAAATIPRMLRAIPPSADWRAMRRMCLAIWISSSTQLREVSRTTASAASAVMSFCIPKAMPTVAACIAGASLIPSPRKRVGARAASSRTIATLSSGLFAE